MKAKALVCDEKQKFSIRDVILDGPTPDQILVRTVYSGVSVGTEFGLIRNKISWGPYPLCTGYMATGIVEKMGSNIKNLKKGDKVYFRSNDKISFPDGKPVSPVSGTHCSHAILKPDTTHGAEIMPAGAPMDAASMFVLPAVGLYGVDMASPKMGQTALVHGAGLIGLGVIAACSHRGCRVIAVDINEKALKLAREFGADITINSAKNNLKDEVFKIVPEGADAVFESTGLPSCVDTAIQLCKTHGSFIWEGNYGDAPLTFNFMAAHVRRLRMFFPCDDGHQPCRRAVIKNMAMGVLDWKKVITHNVQFEDSPAIYEKINKGDRDILGVVIKWSEE